MRARRAEEEARARGFAGPGRGLGSLWGWACVGRGWWGTSSFWEVWVEVGGVLDGVREGWGRFERRGRGLGTFFLRRGRGLGTL